MPSARLSPSNATDFDAVRRRHRDKEVLRDYLMTLCRDEPQSCRGDR